MASDARNTRRATEGESWRLLASVCLGRAVFTMQALPAIRPASHLVNGDVIIIRSHLGSAITAHAAAGAYMGRREPCRMGRPGCYGRDEEQHDRPCMGAVTSSSGLLRGPGLPLVAVSNVPAPSSSRFPRAGGPSCCRPGAARWMAACPAGNPTGRAAPRYTARRSPILALYSGPYDQP